MTEVITVPEAARRLRVTDETVRRWIRQGRLHGVKPGGRKSGYRILTSDVDRMLGIPEVGILERAS